MPWWWPFRKHVFRKLQTEHDCVDAVRALVELSIQQGGKPREIAALDAIVQCGRVIQIQKGEIKAQASDEVYLRALDELMEKQDVVIPAMCHVLLDVVGPEKGWATVILQKIGPPAVPEVSRRLAAARGDMRTHLVNVLDKVGDRRAKDVLETLAKEESKTGESARAALGRMN